jgi:5-methylcytosine-specific restriction protein A
VLFLARHPVCVDPFRVHGQHGEVAAASEVDHITPIDQGGTDDDENLEALCKPCHSRKTAQRDGRWGRGA